MSISGPPIRSPFSQANSDGSTINLVGRDWMKWFQQLVNSLNNTTPETIPGPYANDVAAQAAGIALGALYYDATGVPHVRIV